MNFRYDLVGTGWAECHLELGGEQATVIASYLSDALDSLCAAVIGVLRGDREAEASFEDEPGEYRWKLARVGDDKVRLRILHLTDSWPRQPDERGRTLIDAEVRLRTFAGAVLSELQRLDREFGDAGYRERWVKHEFPRKRLHQIGQLLAN